VDRIDKNPPRFEITGRALVVYDRRLLLVSHGSYWYTPGGRAEPGESLPRCVTREVLEETGIDVTVGELLHLAEYFEVARNRHKVECYFLATPQSPELSANWQDQDGKVVRSRFFGLDELDSSQDVQPAWLRLGTWLIQPTILPVYRGFEKR
jgi:8-oxo-dGTP pyrophosphatase MutT (NUDIX family)